MLMFYTAITDLHQAFAVLMMIGIKDVLKIKEFFILNKVCLKFNLKGNYGNTD